MHDLWREVTIVVSIWPLFVVLAVGLVLTAIYLAGPRVFPGRRPRTRAFWCPFRERNVGVEFRETIWDGTLVDVSRCTVFSPSTAVNCPKGCLELREFPPVHEARPGAGARGESTAPRTEA